MDLLLVLGGLWVLLGAVLIAYGLGRHHGLEEALADRRARPPRLTDGSGRGPEDPLYHVRQAIQATDDEAEEDLLEQTHNQIVALRAARRKREEKKP